VSNGPERFYVQMSDPPEVRVCFPGDPAYGTAGTFMEAKMSLIDIKRAEIAELRVHIRRLRDLRKSEVPVPPRELECPVDPLHGVQPVDVVSWQDGPKYQLACHHVVYAARPDSGS
jgi:hypothetical protein